MKVIREEQESVVLEEAPYARWNILNKETGEMVHQLVLYDDAQNYADGYHIGYSVAVHLKNVSPETSNYRADERLRNVMQGLVDGILRSRVMEVEVVESMIKPYQIARDKRKEKTRIAQEAKYLLEDAMDAGFVKNIKDFKDYIQSFDE